ncbi:hypothetical protein GCM10010109_89960 [Actinoplanes campanulatus]|nr:hypothetical protein GCM10010109_89960 [Actinoplanes campanulatus]GID42081.1 hypothetical protein Aca09nite_85870 [Actinoplanes campanulatus]
MIAGRYRLDDPIASGGMGEVWRATDTVLARPVAVKTLRADRAVDPQFPTRFRHEARAMAALHHPGVVDVYDFGEDDGDGAYLVMARVDGHLRDVPPLLPAGAALAVAGPSGWFPAPSPARTRPSASPSRTTSPSPSRTSPSPSPSTTSPSPPPPSSPAAGTSWAAG